MDYIEIPLTKCSIAIIDTEDEVIIKPYKWHHLKVGYAATSIGGRKNKKMIYMHRLICKAPKGMVVDHINGNKLDNRKSNLRICTQEQNSKNIIKNRLNKTSRYKGVYWDKFRFKWSARIKIDYKNKFLGRFLIEDDAALAYNEAAKKHYGEFACLNQICSLSVSSDR